VRRRERRCDLDDGSYLSSNEPSRERSSETQIDALLAGRAELLLHRGVALEALRPHAERLLEHAPDAAADLLSNGINRSLHELLLLDGGLVELLTGVGIERSLGLYVDGPSGPILGGAWALAPSEAACVGLRRMTVDADGKQAWVFGLPGSFGLAGIADAGHAVMANLLCPALAGPGIAGSALLRRLLAASDLEQARAAIESIDLADGRNWMLADGQNFLGIEQLGDARLLTRVGHKTGHVHANHCFDPSLRQREALPRSAPSFRRLELASTIYVQTRPATAEAVLAFFDEVEVAAFPDAEARASTLLAVEIATGRVLWRRNAAAALEQVDIASRCRDDGA
jgi:hypothetical protein